MTDAELEHIESLFRNPPSASGHHELGLALVAEVRRLKAPALPRVIAIAPVEPPPFEVDPLPAPKAKAKKEK